MTRPLIIIVCAGAVAIGGPAMAQDSDRISLKDYINELRVELEAMATQPPQGNVGIYLKDFSVEIEVVTEIGGSAGIEWFVLSANAEVSSANRQTIILNLTLDPSLRPVQVASATPISPSEVTSLVRGGGAIVASETPYSLDTLARLIAKPVESSDNYTAGVITDWVYDPAKDQSYAIISDPSNPDFNWALSLDQLNIKEAVQQNEDGVVYSFKPAQEMDLLLFADPGRFSGRVMSEGLPLLQQRIEGPQSDAVGN